MPDEGSLDLLEDYVESAHPCPAGLRLPPSIEDLFALGVIQRPRIVGRWFETAGSSTSGQAGSDDVCDEHSSLGSYDSDDGSIGSEMLAEFADVGIDAEVLDLEAYEWFMLEL
ncbi:hypothetical protein TRAPUB_5621 [Trametes pubescens]|uniref:Uncharacterized protein n=1 Tax=Trametes pubescens TaxID=154538 RepID=A0A1M2V845_TRAPU|nr:hypothetical protein TRAPUB_5621 [Trametes pubescens]